MSNEMALDLWHLVSDISVVDAAILIAGGDPSTMDSMQDSDGSHYWAKRTDGHTGYVPVFKGITAAIRKGNLRAVFTHEHDAMVSSKHLREGKAAILTPSNIVEMKAKFSRGIMSFDDRVRDPEPYAAAFKIFIEPDWDQTTVDVEDLKDWLRSRGFTTGFFFPPKPEKNELPDAFMDPSHDHFAPELALAVAAWRALEGKTGFVRGAKEAIGGWIDANPDAWLGDGELSASAKERVVTLANWKKSGGAPASGG